MTRFCLVRHGAYGLLDRALGGRADHPLNEAGRAQAAACGRALAGAGVVAVVSSPVARAWETAAIIGEAVGLPVVIEPDVSEIDFAAWSGMAFADLADDPAWQAWNSDRATARVPGGESISEVQARAIAALQRLSVRWPDGDVAVVSHADVIKGIVASLLELPAGMMMRFEVSAGSLTWIDWQARLVQSLNGRPL